MVGSARGRGREANGCTTTRLNQSILITSVVFTLVIGRVWLHRRVRAAAWVSALVISAGLSVFLIAAEPTGGHLEATAPAWLPALLTCSAVVAVPTFAAGRGSPLRHAALYATAPGYGRFSPHS